MTRKLGECEYVVGIQKLEWQETCILEIYLQMALGTASKK